MRWTSEVRERVRGLLSRARADAETDEELRFHLEMETEENLRRGMSPKQARRQAAITFGGVEKFKEEVRDARGLGLVEDLAGDFRLGVRALGRRPGFALVAVATLALGIGATTAVFSIADGVLLRSLPFAEPERLYSLYEQDQTAALRPPSYPAFEEWRETASTLSGMAYVRGEDFVVRGENGPERRSAGYVAGDFFGALGTPPMLGRVFSDEGPASESEVVLSHRFWSQHFGGDPEILGRMIASTEGTFTVIGVMPPEFGVPVWWTSVDVWAPIHALPPSRAYVLTQRDLHVDSDVVARLSSEVSLEGAQAEMSGLARRLAETYPMEQAGWERVSFVSIPERLMGGASSSLLILGAAVTFVLLIACTNVANLLLARASTRRREIAIRASLGAGRRRLVRQLLTESLLLALGGGVLGVMLAAGAVRLVRTSVPNALPRLDQVSVDGRVMVFALVLSLATTFLFGLLPAFRAASGDLLEPLKNGTPGAGAGRRTVRLRAGLVVTQIALALMLVIGAGLLIKSFWRLQAVELGFNPDGLVLVRVFPPWPQYEEAEAAEELYRRLREAIATVPGVREAALANHLPIAGGSVPTRMVTGDDPPPEGDDLVGYRTVSPEYFSTMQTRLIRGRTFGAEDMAEGGGVVINETAARRFWPDREPIGESVTVFKSAQERPDLGEPITAQVIGVVGNERFADLGSDPPPAVYIPYTWNPWGAIFLVARTDGAPESVIPAMRRAVLAVDPDLPIAGPSFQTEFHTMEEYLARRLTSQRLNTTVLGTFAGSAFLIAMVGIFGVIAYLVVQRTREIAVRVALGARPHSVIALVARQTLSLASAGILLGMAGAALGTRLLRAQLYEVDVLDPIVFIAMAFVFAIAALLAGVLPARSATRVDPMLVLRQE